MKRILLSAFVLFIAGIANAQLISVEFEEHYVHDGTVYEDGQLGTVNLDGYITYRLYANLTNADDFVVNVSGNIDDPLSIQLTDQDEQFFQHPGGDAVGPMNAAIIGFVPLVAYDSYLTIGYHVDADNPTYSAVTAIGGPGNPWLTNFEAGDGIYSDDFTGLAYFVIPGSENGIAGDDLRVSLGQFTVNNADAINMNLSFAGNVQVFTNGESSIDTQEDFYYAFATTAEGGLGCTDPAADNYDATATVDDNSCEYPCTIAINAADLIITDASCFGTLDGSVDVSSITGAQGSILHSTNDGSFVVSSLFNGLPAGDYLYEVRDAEGCIASAPYTIEEGIEIVITENTVDSNNPSCFGFSDGQVCVEIAGGVAPYFTSLATADFSDESSELCFTDLPSGNHVVFVQDDNGCVVNSGAIALNDPLQMSIELDAFSAASCGDVADACGIALATGGQPSFTYEIEGWIEPQEENILCGLLPGMDYTVIATDANGCTVSGLLTEITGPAQVGVNANSVTDVSCFGSEDGGIVVSGFGGNGNFSYSIGGCENFEFNDGIFDALTEGDYVVCAESDGCTGSDTFTVDAPNAIQYDVTPNAENAGVSEAGACDGMFEVINEGGGTGSLTIIWELADGTQVVGNTIDGLCETEMGDVINLTITDENGCVSSEDFLMTIGLYELANNIQINMFPNPTNGIVNLTIEGLAGQAVSAKVLNSIGAEVQSTDFGTVSGIWNKEINLMGQASGVYFLNVTVGNENISHRIIKQ
ncbi:MAG: T9SS type A sorting domain-containing protein [Flavobacteriales bacterium]